MAKMGHTHTHTKNKKTPVLDTQVGDVNPETIDVKSHGHVEVNAETMHVKSKAHTC